MEAVLPRTRTRRKRRKPMPPWLKLYIVMITMDCLFLGYNVFEIGTGKSNALNPIFAVLWTYFLMRDWPRFKAEWDAWKRSNDDE